jgi:hypothetical protein
MPAARNRRNPVVLYEFFGGWLSAFMPERSEGMSCNSLLINSIALEQYEPTPREVVQTRRFYSQSGVLVSRLPLAFMPRVYEWAGREYVLAAEALKRSSAGTEEQDLAAHDGIILLQLSFPQGPAGSNRGSNRATQCRAHSQATSTSSRP